MEGADQGSTGPGADTGQDNTVRVAIDRLSTPLGEVRIFTKENINKPTPAALIYIVTSLCAGDAGEELTTATAIKKDFATWLKDHPDNSLRETLANENYTFRYQKAASKTGVAAEHKPVSSTYVYEVARALLVTVKRPRNAGNVYQRRFCPDLLAVCPPGVLTDATPAAAAGLWSFLCQHEDYFKMMRTFLDVSKEIATLPGHVVPEVRIALGVLRVLGFVWVGGL